MPKNHETFIKKKAKKSPSFNIASIMRTKEVTGDIGIEIEVEGNAFPKTRNNNPSGVDISPELIPAQWGYHHDGSLRGADNAEYVFKKPLKFEEVKGAIDDLWTMFDKFGSVLDESNRTSVHVHLNAQKWHLNRVTAFAALYFSVEELLTEWCGDHRVGNLFCLRAKDAPAIISKLKTFIQNDGKEVLSEGLHYAGLNVQALMKFGSIEIRALRGVTDPSVILDWVAMLERIYKLSGDFPDPRAVCDNFSGAGPMAYLDMVLGDKAQTLKDGISYDNQQIMSALYEGIRLAQDLCYCRDWSEFEPVDVSPDPFKRDVEQVAASLSQMESLVGAGAFQYYNELLTINPNAPVTPTNMIPVQWTDPPQATEAPEEPEEDVDDWISNDWFAEYGDHDEETF